MNQTELSKKFGDEDDLRTETKSLISSLPSGKDFQGEKLCNYQGCWYKYKTLQAVLDFQRNFKPLDTDIIVASYPKSGTTWLKALTVALLERSHDSPQSRHPLSSDSPHGLVPFLEINLYLRSSTPDLTKLSSSPRLFSAHMPLHTLREPLKDSPCKIVYVCRNFKDVLVSRWHFYSKMEKKKVERSNLESMVESFCRGVHFFGPFWDNVLSYWRGSLQDPKHILFMRYEDLKAEPFAQVMRLAEFLGCPFTQEEIHRGTVDEILELCSLRNLSNLDINKTGKAWNNVDHNVYFRKGSLQDPKHILFMRYEDLKAEPFAQVMRLAEFLGCPFTQEEIHRGTVDEILELCSLRNLSNLDINKTGKAWNNVDHNVYFRKGEVDDWKNHLTTEMKNKIDMTINEKFQGSGLKI